MKASPWGSSCHRHSMFITLFTGPMHTYLVFSSSYVMCLIVSASAFFLRKCRGLPGSSMYSSLYRVYHSASCSRGWG